MRYMLMIYEDAAALADASEAEVAAIYAEHGALAEALAAKGAFVAGEQLAPVTTATTVRTSKGKSMIADGPFAETTEHLGGFYVIEADDLDAAMAYARMLSGTVEIRPVVDTSDMHG